MDTLAQYLNHDRIVAYSAAEKTVAQGWSVYFEGDGLHVGVRFETPRGIENENLPDTAGGGDAEAAAARVILSKRMAGKGYAPFYQMDWPHIGSKQGPPQPSWIPFGQQFEIVWNKDSISMRDRDLKVRATQKIDNKGVDAKTARSPVAVYTAVGQDFIVVELGGAGDTRNFYVFSTAVPPAKRPPAPTQ